MSGAREDLLHGKRFPILALHIESVAKPTCASKFTVLCGTSDTRAHTEAGTRRTCSSYTRISIRFGQSHDLALGMASTSSLVAQKPVQVTLVRPAS